MHLIIEQVNQAFKFFESSLCSAFEQFNYSSTCCLFACLICMLCPRPSLFLFHFHHFTMLTKIVHEKKRRFFFLLWFFVIFCCNFIMWREKRETKIAIISSIWFGKCGVSSVNRYKMHVLNIQLYTVSYIHWLLMTFNETQMLWKKHEFNLKRRKKKHLHMLWKGFGTAVTLCLSHCWKLKTSTSAHVFQSTIYMTILQNNEMKPDKWNKRKIALVCVCSFSQRKIFLAWEKNFW